MEKCLSDAEQELLLLYTNKAYERYQAGNLKDTGEYIQKILAIHPGDVNAVFLKGAVCGRKARPGEDMRQIQAAFQIWMPLLLQLEGDAGRLVRDAIAEAFSTMTYTAVEAASRKWDVCQSRSAAEELASTLSFLLDLDDTYQKRKDAAGQWIHSLFTKNYVFWIDTVEGVNKPIPAGQSPAVQAYRQVLINLVRMGMRMPLENRSEEIIRRRVTERLERFEKHSPAGSAANAEK